MKKSKSLIVFSVLIIGFINLAGCNFTPNYNHQTSHVHETTSSNSEIYKKGDKITVLTNHMKGMYKASGTINSVKKTNYYSISYHPTNNPNKLIKDHKWVIEDEI